jgi:hypothetical protein
MVGRSKREMPLSVVMRQNYITGGMAAMRTRAPPEPRVSNISTDKETYIKSPWNNIKRVIEANSHH